MPNTAPESMVMTPDGRTLYVADDGAVTPSTLQQTGRHHLYRESEVGWRSLPTDARFTPIRLDGTVIPISTAANRKERPIVLTHPAGTGSGMTMTPDGKKLFVLAANEVAEGPAYGWIFPIDTATNTPERPIQVSPYATALIMTPDGKTLFVGAAGAAGAARTVTTIDTRSDTVEAVVPRPAGARRPCDDHHTGFPNALCCRRGTRCRHPDRHHHPPRRARHTGR